MEISVKADIAAAKRKLNMLKRQQVPFATSVAINNTAFIAKKDLGAEMARVFDRPTARTLRAVRYLKATKQIPSAKLFLQGGDEHVSIQGGTPAQYLGPEIFGGRRKQKGLEVWMSRAGLISSSEFVVPTSAAKLDGYGNLRSGYVQQIMSQLKLGHDRYSWSSNSARSKRNVKRAGEFFWSRGGYLPRGVWQREGRSVKPILLVVTGPQYSTRFKFHDVARRSVERNFSREFGSALARAIRAAK